MTAELIPSWEWRALVIATTPWLAGKLAHVLAFKWFVRQPSRRWLWSQRGSLLSPIYGAPDPYRTLGPHARQNMRVN